MKIVCFTLLFLFSLFNDKSFFSSFMEVCFGCVPSINYEFKKFDEDEVISEKDVRIKNADSIYVSANNTLYLLDSYEKCIVKANGNKFEKLVLSESVLPADFFIYENYIYVFDEILNELQIYNLDATINTKIPVLLENDYFRKFLQINNAFYFLTFDDNLYSINLLKKEICLEDKLLYNDVYEGFDFSEYVGHDNLDNIYYLQTDIDEDSSILNGKIYLTKKDINKNEILKYEYPLDIVTSLPVKYVFVREDGMVCLLLSVKEKVVVVDLNNYLQKIEKLKEERDLINKEKPSTKKKTANELEKEYNRSGGKSFGLVTYSRTKVLSRVNDIVNYKWILSDDNVRVVSTNLKLPREIEYIASINQQNKDWKYEIEGIPYCWGGFSSIYSNSKNSYNFDYSIENKNFLAGNICTKGSYKGETAGLDCSGYVTLVYGLNEKYSTRTLLQISKEVETFDKLKSMDMLVSPGSHVILFCDYFNDDCLLVSEVAAREGKSLNQIRPLNWFIANGTYQMRSPWK